jgi:hypothetical protein
MFCLEGKDLNSRQIFRRLQKWSMVLAQI